MPTYVHIGVRRLPHNSLYYPNKFIDTINSGGDGSTQGIFSIGLDNLG